MVNYLKCLEKASVMEYNKAECLGIADTSYPSAHTHLFVQVLLFVPVQPATAVMDNAMAKNNASSFFLL